MKRIALYSLSLFLLLSITAYADSSGAVTSRVMISCFNTNIILELDKNIYTTTDVANMTIHILNNNSFPMNSTLVIELRSGTSVIKTMALDSVNIESDSWYNYSYYNNFNEVPTGTYTMRAKLLDLGGNQLVDCNNNALIYDYPNVNIAKVSAIAPGFGGQAPSGGYAPPPLYSVECPLNVEINQPMNLKFNITNPSRFLYQTVLFVDMSKDSMKNNVKRIVITEPNSSSVWYENLGNATCDMPYGLYDVKVTWKKIDGEIIRSDDLGCFNIPPCEKLQIIDFRVNRTVYYVNETSNTSAIVKNTGNVNITNATFNISVENIITNQKYVEQFLIDFLPPGQHYTFKLLYNLTETGPHRAKGVAEKANRILDSSDRTFLVVPRPTQYDILIFFIILTVVLILIVIKVLKRYKEKKEEERFRMLGLLKRVRERNR